MEKINNKGSSVLGSFLGTTTKKSQRKTSSNMAKSSRPVQKKDGNFENILLENNVPVGAIELIDENGAIDETKISLLQDDIHEAGEVLLAKPGIDAVLMYREKVQLLLASIVPLLHRKEQHVSHKRIGNSFEERKYTIIHTIHKKLDRLLQIVINSQAQQMNIMKALDEIKGLIINILH